jgi:hypothetical protein
MNELLPFDKNSYLNFDAVSLKSLIIDRLNKGKVFTGQNYQGSNLSAVIDVISLVFGNLLFYLNKTSSESMFSEVELYENMNKIVKLLNYKPIGKTAPTVPIRLVAGSNVSPNNYTIPRYSYINVGASNFSFTQDVFFSKLNSNVDENITALDDKVLLKQGVYEEYPIYTSTGFDNEIVYLSLDEKIFVDHYSIDVYVKEYLSNQWVKYSSVNELFLHSANETVYEIRYNENKRYEITFGNDINGKKLNSGDQVLVYYLRIDPDDISIGSGGLNNQFIVKYNSLLYPNILDDTNSVNANYLSINDLRNVFVNNAYPSSDLKNEETVDSIRKNAPQTFRSQYRLITKTDYDSYIRNNFSDLITDVKIFNNNEYLMKYMKYVYDIGLKNAGKELNLLFNQVKFSNACNFNNLYFCAVPKSKRQSFLNPPQKEIIINGLDRWKTLTTEIVPLDPVYMMFDFYVPDIKDPSLSLSELSNTKLRIFKSRTTTLSDSMIINRIVDIINQTFLHENCKLGKYIDINRITTNILSLDDVSDIKTINTKTNTSTDGISLLGWNFYYPSNDRKVYTQNVFLEDFKFPVFNNIENIFKKIEIYNETFEQEAIQF